MQIDDELLIGVAVAAAQLVIQMSEDERNRSARIARGVEGAHKSDTIGTAGNGDDHAGRSVRQRTQASPHHADKPPSALRHKMFIRVKDRCRREQPIVNSLPWLVDSG